MKKTLIIIPGFGHNASNPEYRAVAKIAKKKGYIPVFVPVTWQYRGISRWLKETETRVKTKMGANTVILGFSFGAMLAVLLAQRYHCKKLILCSLSPYFKEDLRFIPNNARQWLGKRRMHDFAHYTFPKNSTTSATLIMGDSDWQFGLKKIKERYHLWKGKKKLHILKGVAHSMNNDLYLKAVEQSI